MTLPLIPADCANEDIEIPKAEAVGRSATSLNGAEDKSHEDDSCAVNGHTEVNGANGVTKLTCPTELPTEQFGGLQSILQHIDESIRDISSNFKSFVSSKIPEQHPTTALWNDYAEPPLTTNGHDQVSAGAIAEPESPTTDNSILPTWKMCNWAQFKNSFHNGEGKFCVEALLASASLKTDIDEERKSRQVRAESSNLATGNAARKDHHMPVKPQGEPWIQRIRIRSSTVLKLLNRICEPTGGWTFADSSLIYHRPFRCLIHCQPEMNKELQRLREELLAEKTASASESSGGIAEATVVGAGETKSSVAEQVAEVECYVKFVEEFVMPAYNAFHDPGNLQKNEIRYDDLWYLFKVGELVYVPTLNPAATDSSASYEYEQKVWRVYRIFLPGDAKGTAICDCCANRAHQVTLQCYYIDYDGESYGAISRELTIDQYDGEYEITKLPVYPLRCSKDYDNKLSLAEARGKKFIEHIEAPYSSHSGWTLIYDPQGNAITSVNANGDTIALSPEHIESDVLFDFKEAFNSCPSWKPEFTRESAANVSQHVKEDDTTYIHWSDDQRSQSLLSVSERVIKSDGIFNLEFNQILEQDQYLVKEDTNGPFSQMDLALLPTRLVAYSLWERKFVHVDIRNIDRKVATEQDSSFNKLQIDRGHKRMIQALVTSHFAKRDLEAKGYGSMSQDIIRGKGKGVVILLHGVPGVGKTATAEAVAEKWGKPLFPITCGDLGYTATSVEKSLNDIFRLANLWGCVLLLDEADVFITQRSKEDLKRNALVSVFLRMLEYYNGILFLTTNRPGVLDEAVKSRVHLNLRYEALSMEQTRAVFEINIERLKKIEEHRGRATGQQPLHIPAEEILRFAEDHYKRHGADMGRWNGRQIRNAFSIAASLAHFDSDEDGTLQRALRDQHFRMVDDATLLYDQYRARVLSHTDGEVARLEEVRCDNFSSSDFAGNTTMGRQPNEPSYPQATYQTTRSFGTGNHDIYGMAQQQQQQQQQLSQPYPIQQQASQPYTRQPQQPYHSQQPMGPFTGQSTFLPGSGIGVPSYGAEQMPL